MAARKGKTKRNHKRGSNKEVGVRDVMDELKDNVVDDSGKVTYMAKTQEEELVYEKSAYEMYHNFEHNLPSMSFGVFKNVITEEMMQSGYDLSRKRVMMVCGSTGANKPNENMLYFTQIDNLTYKEHTSNGNEADSSDSSESSDSEREEDKPSFNTYQVAHKNGGVNRLKLIETEFFNGIATLSDRCRLTVYSMQKNYGDCRVVNEFNIRSEGYGLAWNEFNRDKIAVGLNSGRLHVLHSVENNFVFNDYSIYAHNNCSIEDLEWSSNEPNILFSAGCDGTVKVWDVRESETSGVLTLHCAQNVDVNVLSHNKILSNFIVCGDDAGVVRLFDFRNPSACYKEFKHHKQAVTSVEWHPTDETTFACAGEDNQVTIWDFEAEPAEENEQFKELHDELLFVHMGQNEVKEVHWHPQYPGMLLSTALDGINIFKTISV